MTYTPTKEELEEVGFKKYSDDVYATNSLSRGRCYISVWKLIDFYIFFLDESGGVCIYPRSLDHLRQIILAFTPNE